jgi:flagellar motor switch protein FliM
VTPLDAEEVEALIGARAAPARVAERDFARPLRLGAERLAALRRRLEIVLHKASTRLSSELGRAYRLELAGIREVHADAVRQGLSEPLAAARFQSAGQPAWAVWSNDAAVRALEMLLCGSVAKTTARALSELEASIMLGALEAVVRELAGAAGAVVDKFQAVTALATLGTWTEAGDGADPGRVALDLHVRVASEQSELVVYLPGLAPPAAAPPAPETLPEHLDPVEVVLSARLGEIEIALCELLDLEHGDVIPLGTPEDGTLAVTVDGFEFARAQLGTSEGSLAVRLTEVHPPA